MREKTILYVENVTVSFDGFIAIRDLNFYMNYGELRVVIGPNGAGKTTLLDVICGKVKPVKGRVIFGENDVNITGMSEHEIVKKRVGRKFQAPSIFTNLTVFENFELSLRKNKGVFSTLFMRRTKNDHEKIFSILETIKLTDKAHEKAGSLSHGQKQWVEIGMVIAQDPELLLIDEPVAGMSNEETEKTGELLLTIAKNHSILVIEHDMEFVRQIAHKVTVLHEGMLLCEGSMEEVQNDARVIEKYLGRGK
ncbi:MAG TPA: urea ABC transporter ATP-binding protein UrtD [Candidatus Wunengus sp. YC63]|uniref:urea ABC transporter ATP-binding protein UrtD n=1 Tax=Candidatus Wunengus sp. YC63 TaxID=3367699 RepID=UPI0027137A25|nr:urea ABC transporter ATP-binding protein UrtD [Candidatus Brocadiales bacterium]